jgi:signal peptidase I
MMEFEESRVEPEETSQESPAEAGAPAPPGNEPLTAAPPPAPVSSRSGPGQGARLVEELVTWFKTLVSAAVYATLIVTFGFQVARVDGQSMVPTLQDQDRLIVNKLAYRLHDPQIGDVVMLLWPVDPDKAFVKRVVAGPGDTIRSDHGTIYRNGVRVPDDFIPEEDRANDTWGPDTIKEGFYFVMGDHRNNSSDSRAWGLVPKMYILGKVQIRWWPLDHAKVF